MEMDNSCFPSLSQYSVSPPPNTVLTVLRLLTAACHLHLHLRSVPSISHYYHVLLLWLISSTFPCSLSPSPHIVHTLLGLPLWPISSTFLCSLSYPPLSTPMSFHCGLSPPPHTMPTLLCLSSRPVTSTFPCGLSTPPHTVPPLLHLPLSHVFSTFLAPCPLHLPMQSASRTFCYICCIHCLKTEYSPPSGKYSYVFSKPVISTPYSIFSITFINVIFILNI